MSDDQMSVEAVGLLAQLMQRNADDQYNLMSSLLAGSMAREERLHDGVTFALATIEFGGTTAQYEQGMSRLRLALYPPQHVVDLYHDRGVRRARGEDLPPVTARDWFESWEMGGPA